MQRMKKRHADSINIQTVPDMGPTLRADRDAMG